MKTFSAILAICAGNSPVTGWVNNREAGDLRRHRAHYDVIVMNRARYGMTSDCAEVFCEVKWNQMDDPMELFGAE